MNKNQYILADFAITDPLSEYHSYRNLDLDYLPDVPDSPVVDVIAHRILGKEKVTLILRVRGATLEEHWHTPQAHESIPGTLEKLYKQKSKYNDFVELSKNIDVIVYQEDCVLEDLGRIARGDPDFCAWLNVLKPTIFAEGLPGKFYKEHYPDCEFIGLGYPYLERATLNYPHLSAFKNHSPRKDFLCLMFEKPSAPNRTILFDKMQEKGTLENTICNYRKRGDYNANFSDLSRDYSDMVQKGVGVVEILPAISHYNDTNLEIVAESLNKENYDDTFYITDKTVKPIGMAHPFMVLTNYNFLHNLRELGFRTFGDHLDESYDTEQDVHKRVEIITDNLVALKGSSLELYNNTREIREHNLTNLQHLIGRYKTKLWTTLDQYWQQH